MSQLAQRAGSTASAGGAVFTDVGLPPRGGARMAGRSRMSREAHVRICAGLEVKFLRSTRPAISRRQNQLRESLAQAGLGIDLGYFGGLRIFRNKFLWSH